MGGFDGGGQLLSPTSVRTGGVAERRVFPDREAEPEVAAAFIGQVIFPDRDRVDVPDRAFRFLDEVQGDDQCVDELLEVIIRTVDTQMLHGVALHHVGVGLVVGSVLTTVV
jgi:hypothetical protein